MPVPQSPRAPARAAAAEPAIPTKGTPEQDRARWPSLPWGVSLPLLPPCGWGLPGTAGTGTGGDGSRQLLRVIVLYFNSANLSSDSCSRLYVVLLKCIV